MSERVIDKISMEGWRADGWTDGKTDALISAWIGEQMSKIMN